MPLTTSKQPRKQRKAQANAPAHQARKMIAAHLAGDLLVKYNRRSLAVVVGDTVKVLRGSHKGHTGKVAEVDVTRRRIVVEGVTTLKADGTKVPRGVDPSNVVITKPNLADARRRDKLAAGVTSAEDKKRLLSEMEAAGKEDAAALEEARRKEEEEREKARAEREAEEHDHDHDDHDHEHKEER